jgi:urease accessory protein
MLMRLLYAASPARPTGSFAWSGGLAPYLLSGEVKSSEGLKAWIGDAVRLMLVPCDLPLLCRCFGAAVRRDAGAFARWNSVSFASRGTRELFLGESETGASVMRMLEAGGLADGFPEGMREGQVGYVAAYGLMGAALGLSWDDRGQLAAAFLWGAVENLALCAAKSVPLGQSAVQAVLMELLDGLLPRAVEEALLLDDRELGASAPLLAIRSSGHESSPLRMFRS